LLSELLARRAKKVIAVDNSAKIVAFGAQKAKKNGLKNLEFRLGDLENPPIDAVQRRFGGAEPGAAPRPKSM
jgi:tRNA/tmRNA/rRNA uracil-C5-methylase (TrmA/RlmC/RlmD family)